MTRQLQALILLAGSVLAQSPDAGIAVTDPLVQSKCGSCHPGDASGNLEHISWLRTTPEGWQDVLKRMIATKGLTLSEEETRSIVTYLSDRHGLAPEESKPAMHEPERRILDEETVPTETLRTACAKCHPFARVLSSRRSLDEWEYFGATHAARYRAPLNEEAFTFLGKSAPLHTSEWDSWISRDRSPKPSGRWLVTAHIPGRGKYVGEMNVTPAGAENEFNSATTLQSVRDGSTIKRSGEVVVFGGSAWRGNSKGDVPGSAADDPGSDAREVVWVGREQSKGEGRWFWGQYQEFGFDITLQRPSAGPTLLAVDRSSLAAGSRGIRLRFLGDNLPAKVRPADWDFGSGVAVRRVVSRTAREVVVEVDVAAGAPFGKRDVALGRSVLPHAIAIYDRVDYVKVTPESALAGFGNQRRERGYQQFEAIGYQRGPDGKSHTADDLDLGPLEVTWSMEVFYAREGSNTDHVGKVSPGGLFAPAAESPNNNFDVWVIATAKGEKNKNGKPLVGKAYLVVTVPEYTFNGRRYVRELDRWLDDGPAQK